MVLVEEERFVSDTIFALSSGRPPAGIAVVRLSGERVRFVIETMCGKLPSPRQASLRTLRNPASGEAIDQALVLFFPAPGSFTGEDVAEFHVHGGRAVVAAVLAALSTFAACRPAERGEFTRRAYETGRIDLTEVEGLADLVAAETEAQRRQALGQAAGGLSRRAEAWRAAVLRAEAYVEADLDFSDEEDVPGSLVDEAKGIAVAMRAEIGGVLDDGHRGERLRDGFEVVIMGRPNAGKSTLMNAIAGRDVAIVTERPGTTRDVLEVHLDLDGYPVTLVDTAGVREVDDAIEAEGIRRAKARGAASDLVLWLDEWASPPEGGEAEANGILRIMTKADLGRPLPGGWIGVSAQDGGSVSRLIDLIGRKASDGLAGEASLITAARQRWHLERVVAALDEFIACFDGPEIAAEALRRAATEIGRLTGRIDVEEVLGAIFGQFCIGK